MSSSSWRRILAREWLLLLGVALVALIFWLVTTAFQTRREVAERREQHAAAVAARDEIRKTSADHGTAKGNGEENPFLELLSGPPELEGAEARVKATESDLRSAERSASASSVIEAALGAPTWGFALLLYLLTMFVRSIVWSVRALRRA